MKINELYDIDSVWEKIDRQFNPENLKFRGEETDRYEEIAALSKGETPVIVKEPTEEDRWTNAPQKGKNQSPGYRAGESTKKRSDVPYKKYNKASEQDQRFMNGNDF